MKYLQTIIESKDLAQCQIGRWTKINQWRLSQILLGYPSPKSIQWGRIGGGGKIPVLPPLDQPEADKSPPIDSAEPFGLEPFGGELKVERLKAERLVAGKGGEV